MNKLKRPVSGEKKVGMPRERPHDLEKDGGNRPSWSYSFPFQHLFPCDELHVSWGKEQRDRELEGRKGKETRQQR